ncbi:CsbD family protein [Kocuria rhizophila]
MGLGDKISNAAEKASGSAKEKLGDVTDNRDLQAEGAADKASGGAKQSVENVKDAGKNLKDGLS